MTDAELSDGLWNALKSASDLAGHVALWHRDGWLGDLSGVSVGSATAVVYIFILERCASGHTGVGLE